MIACSVNNGFYYFSSFVKVFIVVTNCSGRPSKYTFPSMFYSLILISKPSFRLSNIMNYVSDLYYTVYVPVLRRLTIEVSLKKFYGY